MYNTLDLDFTDKETLTKIVMKITKCSFSGIVRMQDTSKGYHLKFNCAKECDLCRVVFDDDHRYMLDMTTRTKSERNIMFDSKTTPAKLRIKKCQL